MVINALLAILTRDDKASNRSNVKDNDSNNSADPSLISSYVNGDLIQFSDASFNKQNFGNVTRRKKPNHCDESTPIASPIKTFSKKSVNEQIIEFRNFHNIKYDKRDVSATENDLGLQVGKNRQIKVKSFSRAHIEDFYG